jgi:hypothetical protein
MRFQSIEEALELPRPILNEAVEIGGRLYVWRGEADQYERLVIQKVVVVPDKKFKTTSKSESRLRERRRDEKNVNLRVTKWEHSQAGVK